MSTAREALPKSGLLRALLVLEHIREVSPEPVGVSMISRDLSMPKAVVHRILKDFVSAGYLNADEATRQYVLGPSAFTLGLTAFQAMDIPMLARGLMEDLVRQSHETATLSMRQGWWRVYVDQVESPQEIRMAVSLGSRHPLHAGSSSKAILAALSDVDQAKFFEKLSSPTTLDNHIPRHELEQDISDIRNLGYATSFGERQSDAGSVASPIYSHLGEVWGAISVCGPLYRFNAGRSTELGFLVAEAAAEISGGRRPYSPPHSKVEISK